jgi:hypothetical protein
VGGSVVMTLIEDYIGTYRKLYTDNWYTSPSLYKVLLENCIYACGTVNIRRLGMPRFDFLQKGCIQAKYSGELLALKWRDRKDIHMLSTCHDASMGPSSKLDRETGLPVMKPECIINYSLNMGSVDNADMMISSVQSIRKTIKWYKKLALHIFDMYLLNAFYLYRAVKKIPCPLAKFQLELIRQMIAKYNATMNTAPLLLRNTVRNPLRILPGNAAEHMPKYIANHKSQRCKVCTIQGQRKSTRYFCSVCNVSLCVVPCFKDYHQNQGLGN